MWRRCLCLVLALCLIFGASALKKIDAPCTACKAVAAEIQLRINREPVRNHLDLRHRLDKDGQRYGKVISYKASELRAVELLDGLCDRMRDFALVSPSGKRTKFWLRVKGDHAQSTANVTRTRGQEEDAKAKRLEAYCGTLIEEYEDEVYEGIMKGGFDTAGVESVLCRGIIKACPASDDDGTPAVEAGEVVEGEDDWAEAEAAEVDAAEPAAAAANGEASGGVSSQEAEGEGSANTKYIENMTVEMGADGKFEL